MQHIDAAVLVTMHQDCRLVGFPMGKHIESMMPFPAFHCDECVSQCLCLLQAVYPRFYFRTTLEELPISLLGGLFLCLFAVQCKVNHVKSSYSHYHNDNDCSTDDNSIDSLHSYFSRLFSKAGISLVSLATGIPAALKAAIFSLAVPALLDMMAPACPICLPSGASRPDMKATTGLVT